MALFLHECIPTGAQDYTLRKISWVTFTNINLHFFALIRSNTGISCGLQIALCDMIVKVRGLLIPSKIHKHTAMKSIKSRNR